MESTVSVGRKPLKRDHIVRELRRRIATGDLAPGARIPTQQELESRYATGNVTVRTAIAQLVTDGFLRTARARGTFVVEDPPHLCQFGLVFSGRPDCVGEPWSNFSQAIHEQAQGYTASESHRRRLLVYYGIRINGDAREHHRLARDIDRHRLGGLIFMNPTPAMDAPEVAQQRIAAVCVMDQQAEHMPSVYVDFAHWIRLAMGQLAAAGRRRVAVLAVGPMTPPLQRAFDAEVNRLSMETRRAWTFYLNPWIPGSVENVMHLLFQRPDDLPDAMLIFDDNLVTPATRAMAELGLNIPKDLDVIAHCNFPLPTPSALPIVRLGFDTHQLLHTCIDLIERQREGEATPPLTLIPARLAPS